jgi:HlyD family secretion protein
MAAPVLAAALFTVPGLYSCGAKKAGGGGSYEFALPGRGTLERTVSASGSLNPVAQVNVLPRMSGKVEKVYVDYNDPVKQGEVLAELNTDMLRLQREQQMAQVIKARANYELQRLNYQNQVHLAEKNLISEYELKTGKTALDVQGAELAAAEASLRVIETEINQYAFVTSPIDGIVLERKISAGDTVVDSSSNNSSSIFTLAENLTEMRIEAGVGELDVASIYKGQPVRFTLESLPGRSFAGVVETLRLVPTAQNNVVSYTVIIGVENQDGSLLPGMTCAVDFVVERREEALMVPNAALRYRPANLSDAEIAELEFNAGLKGMSGEQRAAALAEREGAARTAAGQSSPARASTGLAGLVSGGGPGPGMPGGAGPGMGGGPGMGAPGGGVSAGSGSGRSASGGSASGGSAPGGSASGGPAPMKNLWFINGEGKLDLVRVRTGITNGTHTEVRSGEDLEGLRFILREKIQ